MGIALSPVSDEVRVDPTIKLPTFRRLDDQSFVSGTQEVPPYSFYCFGMTLFGILGKPCALMYADGYIWACGFFQKIEFANDAAIMKVRSHLGAVYVLVE